MSIRKRKKIFILNTLFDLFGYNSLPFFQCCREAVCSDGDDMGLEILGFNSNNNIYEEYHLFYFTQNMCI